MRPYWPSSPPMPFPHPRPIIPAPNPEHLRSFTRGLIAAACVTSVESAARGRHPFSRRVLRKSLQGGIAMAAGAGAANAVQARRYGRAVAAAGVGLVGVALVEHLLADATPHADDHPLPVSTD